jgi:hypothetical protein
MNRNRTSRSKNFKERKGMNGSPKRDNKKNCPEKKTYIDEEGKEQPMNNDVSWYFDNAVLAEQVSSISFNQFIGTAKTFDFTEFNPPVAAALFLNPSVGWMDESDPTYTGVNQQGIKLYTALSSGNAKTTQYAPQDVTTLILALGEVISLSEAARRAMGLAFTYNKRNWAYAADVIRMAGFDPVDLFSNLAAYRIRFNTIINKVNKIAFPDNIRWFKKCSYLYSHLFLDSESPMSQTYFYRPYSTWIIDETGDEGTILRTKQLNLTESMDSFLDKLEEVIDAILSAATFQYIYADILRLYGDAQLYTLPFLTEDYIVVPEYDPLAKLQINNAIITGEPNATERDLNVTPKNDVWPVASTNKLAYSPEFTTKKHPRKAVLNFPHSMGNPDVVQRIEASRFVSLFRNSSGEGGAALADHYVVQVIFYGPAADTKMILQSSYVDDITTVNPNVSIAEAMAIMSEFDGVFRLYVDDEQTYGDYIYGDLDYFTDIDLTYLSKVNELMYACIYSGMNEKQ